MTAIPHDLYLKILRFESGLEICILVWIRISVWIGFEFEFGFEIGLKF